MIKQTIMSFVFLMGISKLWATDYYVDAISGNDGNSGNTTSSAFRSLDKINQLDLLPGDVVYFMEGTYSRPGQTLLTIDVSGTADRPIIFRNFEGHHPLLEFDGWTGIDLINGASYITIKGLKIKGARSKITLEEALEQPGGCAKDSLGNPIGRYNGTGILAVGPNLWWTNGATTGDEVPHHITIEDCEIFDCTSSGIAFQQADYITVKNNKIYDNCWYTIYGTSAVNLYQFINIDGTTGFHNEISNNLIHGNQLLVPQIPYCSYYDGNAIIVDDFRHIQTSNYKNPDITYDAYSAKTLIYNNIAVKNGGSGLHFYLSGNCHVYHNAVIDNAFQNEGVNGNAELRMGGCYNFKVKNNIFKGTKIHNNGGNWSYDYTHNYQSGAEIDSLFANDQCHGCIEGQLNFANEDPHEIMPYLTDFEGILKSSGTPIDAVKSDYLGHPRSGDSTSVDIGAYTLQSCYPTRWYSDIDNDGIGDGTQSVESCEQPQGYVAAAGDLCPEDQHKQEPMECGCNVQEDSCDIRCTAADYDAQKIYSASGTRVIYNGIAYENQWHTQGDIPSAGGPWMAIAVCEANWDCTLLQEWQNQTPYTQPGSLVVYENLVYQNQWYTQGNTPNQNQVWTLVGGCNGQSAKTYTTTSPSKEVSLYPTQVLDRIFITTPEHIAVVLYDLSGQKVASWSLAKGKNLLQLSEQAAGLYILKMQGAAWQNTTKLVKL